MYNRTVLLWKQKGQRPPTVDRTGSSADPGPVEDQLLLIEKKGCPTSYGINYGNYINITYIYIYPYNIYITIKPNLWVVEFEKKKYIYGINYGLY